MVVNVGGADNLAQQFLEKIRLLVGGAVAAAAAGYMIVRPPFGLWPPLQELAADYRTKKGEQRTISVVSEALASWPNFSM